MLADSSVWIEHLRKGHPYLSRRLGDADIVCHPFVIGEIACGNLSNRREILALMNALPQVPVADHDEVLVFLEAHHLMGTGIGWIDAHLLASVMLAGETLFTLDRRLKEVTGKLGLGVGS